MALYAKDKRFSVGWMIGGAVLMFITNFFGGFVAAGLGITSIYEIAGISVACYGVGGFVIGWQSEGQTIIEAGLAGAITTVVAIAIRHLQGAELATDPIALVIGLGIPFVAGIIGAWIGEKVQGDTVGTDD